MAPGDIDPLVAAVVGDISDLVTQLAAAEGVMSGFAASASGIEFNPVTGGTERLGADLAAGLQDAAPAAEDLHAEMRALEQAIASADSVSAQDTEQLVRETEAMLAATEEASSMSHAMAAGAEAAHQANLQQANSTGSLKQAIDDADLSVGKLGEHAGSLLRTFGLLEAGGIGSAAVFSALGLSVLGAGLLIADFGGTAQAGLAQVEGALRGTAERASVAFEPAINSIVSDFRGLASYIEPDVQQMFTALAGPAEVAGHNLAGSLAQGFDAAVPAVEQIAPLLEHITADIGPLLQGVAGFGQQMAAAFEAGGGAGELDKLASEIGQLLPVIGQLAGEMGSGLLEDATLLTPALRAVADVLNALGPDGDAAVGMLLMMGKAMSVINDVTGPLDTAIGLVKAAMAEWTAGNEMAAASAVEAGAAMDAEAVEATVASAMIAESALAFIPYAAAAAAVIAIGAELVMHWQAVSDFFGQLGSEAYDWGVGIVDGIGKGIEDAWNAVFGPIESMVTNIKNWITHPLGISSPSTVTREYGLNFGQGFGLGVQDSQGLVHAAVGGLAASALGAFGAGGSVGGGGGAMFPSAVAPLSPGGGVTIGSLVINVEAPLANATPAEIANAIIPAIQSLNIDNGTSMTAHTGLKGT